MFYIALVVSGTTPKFEPSTFTKTIVRVSNASHPNPGHLFMLTCTTHEYSWFGSEQVNRSLGLSESSQISGHFHEKGDCQYCTSINKMKGYKYEFITMSTAVTHRLMVLAMACLL